jgi:hypothetical protein
MHERAIISHVGYEEDGTVIEALVDSTMLESIRPFVKR